jgi:hypothetical protein
MDLDEKPGECNEKDIRKSTPHFPLGRSAGRAGFTREPFGTTLVFNHRVQLREKSVENPVA